MKFQDALNRAEIVGGLRLVTIVTELNKHTPSELWPVMPSYALRIRACGSKSLRLLQKIGVAVPNGKEAIIKNGIVKLRRIRHCPHCGGRI